MDQYEDWEEKRRSWGLAGQPRHAVPRLDKLASPTNQSLGQLCQYAANLLCRRRELADSGAHDVIGDRNISVTHRPLDLGIR